MTKTMRCWRLLQTPVYFVIARLADKRVEKKMFDAGKSKQSKEQETN
jgi:hypothetical protein